MIGRTRRTRRRVAHAAACAGAAALVAVGLTQRALAVESVWNGGISDWGNPAAWTPAGVPQAASDDASIGAGQVTLDASYSIGALTLGGGLLKGTNDLTLNGLVSWIGGTMADTGTTRATAGMLLGGADKILNARTIVNDALATWDGGNIVTANGAAIHNGGTFVAAFDGHMQSQGTATFFTNAGAFRKTVGAGGTAVTTISPVFNSSGAVQVLAGRLALAGGGSASGAFELSGGTELALRNDYTFAGGSSVGGAGNVGFEFGNATIAGGYAITGTTTLFGGTIDFAGAASTKDLVLFGGLLSGGGTLSASGATTWTGTILEGAGSVVSTGTLSMAGPGHGLSARTLTNAGTGTWSGGNILFAAGATLSNTGTLTASFNGAMQTSGANPGTFANAGLFARSGPGATTINPVLTSSGTVRVSEGTLTVAGGGSASGRFEVLANARLRIVNDYTFAPGSRIEGSGKVEFAGGVNAVAGTYDVTGGTDIFGGVTTFSGNVANLGTALTLLNGFAKFDAPLVQANKLDQFGGGIDGSGNVVFNGPVTWESGPQKGSGTTTAAAGLVISGPGGKALEGRTLVNAAGSSATWSAGDILGFGGGTLRNDGTFDVTFDGNFFVANGTPQFLNTGLLIKSGGTGVAAFNAALNNSGTVRVDAGSLFLGAGSSTGRIDLEGGGAQFATYTLGQGASVTGTNKALITGVLSVSGAATAKRIEQGPGTQMNGAGALTIEAFDWLGGRLAGGGTTTVTATLNLAGQGKEIDGRTLRIDPGAAATWSAGDLAIFAGSTLDNAGTLSNAYDGNVFQSGTVSNSGLFVKSGGTGATTSLAAFANSGTVRVEAGKVFLAAGASTGRFDLVGGPIELSGGYGLGNGASITGTNAARFIGTVNVSGAATAQLVEQASGGETAGVGNLSIEHFTWTGGRLTGSGATTITADVALAGGGKEIDGRTLRILPAATATWSAGDIGAFPGAIIDNAGTFNATFDGNLLYAFTRSAAFANSGLMVKSAGTGRTTLDVFFNNTGTARVASGTLLLSGGGTSSGNFDLAGGGVELTGGYALAAGATITGTNVARIVGDISVGGAVSAKNVVQTGGVAGGAGTFTIENFAWQGGTLGGSGATVVTGALDITGGLKSIDGRTLRVAAGAVANWNAGDIRAGGAGLIENLGTFNAASDNTIFPGDGVTARFANAGLFNKTGGGGTTSISLPLDNTGVVRVSSGVVSLGGGGSSTGQFDLLAGPIELGGGYVLAGGATITGTHAARLSGNVSVTGAVAAGAVEQTAGTVAGGGTFTVGNYAWTGGAMAGPGATAINSALSIAAPSVTLDARTLNLAAGATTTWSAGTIFTANGARIDNAGLFLNTFDGTVVYQTGVPPVFGNGGEFRKSGGTGVTAMGIRFDNAGTARVNTGTLRLAGGGTASGNFDVAAGSVVELAFDYTLAGGATFTGPGKARVTGGAIAVNGAVSAVNIEHAAGTVTGPGNLSAANYDWKGGTLAGTGTTTATTELAIHGADLNLTGRTLAVAPGATAIWFAGDVRFSLGAAISNAGTFDIAADVNAVRIDGIDAVFNNTGTLRKTAGANVAAFAGVTLNNAGTLDVSSGTLNVAVTQFDLATATLTGGTWRVGNGAKLDLGGGPGIATNLAHVTLDGPTANFTKINDLTDNRGTLALKNGRQFFTGGTFANSGTVTADAASGVQFGNVFHNSGTYTSAGTTSVNFAYNSGAFTQTGPLAINLQFVNDAPGVADLGGPQAWGNGAHLIVNGGTVKLRTDTGAAGAPKVVLESKGGVTEIRTTHHLKGLKLAGGTVKVLVGGSKILRTGGYEPAGTPGNFSGQIDVANNKLIVDYTANSPVETIAEQIKSGFNAGGVAWTGNGIVSSTVAAAGLALGYAEASEVPGAVAAFGGEVISGNAVLIRPTLPGDATLDGIVDFNDLVRLAQNYNTTVSATTGSWWFAGDFSYDGITDFNDLVKLAQNYNTSLPAAGAIPGAPASFNHDLAAAFASVPEPSTIAGIAACGFAVLARRRRRDRHVRI